MIIGPAQSLDMVEIWSTKGQIFGLRTSIQGLKTAL